MSDSNALTACHEESLRLLELGYRPLAVDPEIKAPWYPWLEFQTRQPTLDEIGRWFRERPDAGIAISTNGLLVVDVDGSDTVWPPDRECCSDLMGVPQVATPRGGAHFYFKQTPAKPHAGTVGKLQQYVDTRANGNLVVLPPTQRPDGTRYEWVGEPLDCGPEHLALPPDWLQAAIDAIGSNRVSLYASKPFRESIPQGQRNLTFYRLACLLRDVGCDEAMMLGALEGINNRQPAPLGSRELIAISHSAAKYEPAPAVNVGDITGVVTAAGPDEQQKAARALSLAELEERPAPTWLFDGIIQDNSLGFIIGDPGAGKSLLLLDLAFGVACGRPLLGNGPLPNRTGWVLLLLAEGSGSWAARSRAFRSFYNIEQTGQIAAVIDAVDFSGPEQIQRLTEIIKAEIVRRNGTRPALIILDTLSAAIPGMDENLQAAMSPVTSTLQKWVRVGVPVIVAHHPAKSGGQYRGSSVLKASADWMISLKRAGQIRRLSDDKLRDVAAIADCSFEVIDHNGTGVARGAAPVNFRGIVDPAPSGLLAALRKHGWTEHVEDARNGDLQRNGITLDAILATWRRLEPIAPRSAEDKAEYNKVLDARLTDLLRWVQRAKDDGIVEITDGVVSGKSKAARAASKKATIKQVGND